MTLNKEEFDNTEDFEAKETANVIPMGWLLLFVGLIIWGMYYVAAYSPSTTGWTQSDAYEESIRK